MSITSNTKNENCIVELEIAVDAQRLKTAADQAFRKRAKTITVPGFRKGKAPRQVIEKMYGDGVFLEDAVNDLYPTAYEEAVEEAGISPVDKANIEILSMDKETGFTFKATVTVKPQVEIGRYKELEAVKNIYRASDEDVDSEINRMRERGARIVTAENRPAAIGDTAVIDFEGFMDGVAFSGGKGENHSLVLGSKSFIDTFEDQIVGHSVGDEFDVNVTFPDEYHTEDLKGKPAVFKVKLNEIKEKQLPDIDDEFAKDVSEFDTVDELRTDLLAKMQDALDHRSTDELESALLDEVIKDLSGFIPEVMFENRIDELLRDFSYRLASQGMNLETYLQYTGMDVTSLRESFRLQAERQVKMRLALETVAAKENLTASPEDVEAEVAKLSESYGIDADEVRSMLNVKTISEDIVCNKALNLIRDSAKVTEEEKELGETQSPVQDADKAGDDAE